MAERDRVPLIRRFDPNYLQHMLSQSTAGDTDAFASIYALTCQAMYRMIFKRLRNEYQTQDAMQDVYIRLYTDRNDADMRIHQWILKIATEVCESYIEKEYMIDEGKEIPWLTIGTAEQMIRNILEYLQLPANNLPIETYIEYGSYRHSGFVMRRVALACMILIVLGLPVSILKPEFSCRRQEASEIDLNAVKNQEHLYSVEIEGPLTANAVTAEIEEVQMPVYKVSNGYVVAPTRTGKMTITVTAWNGQKNEEEMIIE